jgi:hypothetical protein
MRVLLAVVCFSLALHLSAQQKPAASPKDSAPATATKPTDSPSQHQSGAVDSIDDVLVQHAPVVFDPKDTVSFEELVAKWTKWDGQSSSTLTPKTPITEFGSFCKPTQVFCAFKDDIYIVQITTSSRPEHDPATPAFLKSSSWYLFKPTRDRKSLVLKQAVDGKFQVTIGSHTGVLISVSLLENPNCEPASYGKFKCEPPPGVTYDVALTEKTPANVTALLSLANAVLGTSATAQKGPGVAPKTPKFSGTVLVYQLDARKPHLPFDWAITATVKDSDTGSGGDCTKLTQDAKCTFTHTVSVDAPQYWNVGIDITPHGPRENKYALSNSNIVTQSHTIHSPLYAAFDFSLWPQQGYRPYFQVGVPLSGAAFHLPFVAVAEPLPFTKKFLQLSVYGGVVFMQQTFPQTLKVGQTSNTAAFNADLVTDRALKPIFGIEVPVSSIISKVKSSVGSAK